jgi:hypothetical protein
VTAAAETKTREAARRAERDRVARMPVSVRCGFPLKNEGTCDVRVSPRFDNGKTRCAVHRGLRGTQKGGVGPSPNP